MNRQAKLHAIFLGQSTILDDDVFNVLEARGIKTLRFDDPDEFFAFFRDHASLVGALVICPQSSEAAWQKLGELLDRRKSDYIPFIDVSGEFKLPAFIRARRLVYSLAQPVDVDSLATTIQVAFLEHLRYRDLIGEVQSRSSAIGTIRAGTFEVRTIREAKNLTTMLSLACPNPKSAAFVLSELIINAIEHGNLGITYAEKSALVASGGWEAEVSRRLALDDNRDKKVTVRFERDGLTTHITIEDMGQGFDWRQFTDTKPDQGKQMFSGRGIKLANAMENCEILFRGVGNVVTVMFYG